VLLGLAVAGVWVGLDGHYPKLGFLGGRTAFDPAVLGPRGKWVFVAVRLTGLVVLVPVVEELFWRSFVWRWLTDGDIRRVPIGAPAPSSVVVTSVLFGLAHPEWLPGVLTGFAWAGLLVRTKSVSACVLSHAVANLALGLYVLATGEWKFW
jgi:CAAX prenyl protease-like protein